MDRLLEATARAERDHFWFRGFRRFMEPLLAGIASGRRIEILDCGCGTGHNLQMLRRYGRAYGIDLTWSGLQYAHRQGEKKVAQATVGALPAPGARFDLVTSFDVLYGLPEDVETAAIAEMMRVLKPGGWAIVNVAALPWLRGNHSVLGGELRRYRRRELRDKLERAGFRVTRTSYTNFSIFPLVAAVRVKQRFSGHVESDAEITVPAAPVNAALSALLSLEAAALRVVNMPIGSSVMAVAQKPY
ncbi:MAG TPA: class I SAM-dependent methyltransferase [Vicinamibacterales bacterium]|nr:class I SAM-dependent methyltransferase [Vicinamibacterales bacterium]